MAAPTVFDVLRLPWTHALCLSAADAGAELRPAASSIHEHRSHDGAPAKGRFVGGEIRPGDRLLAAAPKPFPEPAAAVEADSGRFVGDERAYGTVCWAPSEREALVGRPGVIW